MGKYDALGRYLASLPEDPVEMSFREIEQLGIELPFSARTYDAWWLDRSSGTTHSHAFAWLASGRQVGCVNRADSMVTFTAARAGV